MCILYYISIHLLIHRNAMMLKNYFRIAKRDISKNKLYTILHVSGLSLGFVCCLFIYLYIDFHRSFDVYHAQAERTFRLVNELHLETVMCCYALRFYGFRKLF